MSKKRAEELKPDQVAKVHVDGDIRMPKAVRDEFALKPGEKWMFSVVVNSEKEKQVKFVKVA